MTMFTTQLLDSLPILGVFVAFAIVSMLFYEGGFKFGPLVSGNGLPVKQEGPTTCSSGRSLALLAFLLAVTMGMASDRFDARRGIVLDEANSIGTTYLRAGYLPRTGVEPDPRAAARVRSPAYRRDRRARGPTRRGHPAFPGDPQRDVGDLRGRRQDHRSG